MIKSDQNKSHQGRSEGLTRALARGGSYIVQLSNLIQLEPDGGLQSDVRFRSSFPVRVPSGSSALAKNPLGFVH